MQRGTFITFEGGEGSGKSTQARRLAERLRTEGLDVVETREPGGSPFAEVIRGVLLDPRTPPHAPLSEALLFYAARADHIAAVIRPALAAGRWVVSDRFSDSTLVYQGHAGHLENETIATLEKLVVGATRADLTIIIDIPAEVGLKRASARRTAGSVAAADPDAYERRDLDFHRRLREGFLSIAVGDPKRCRVIDGEAPLAEVEARVWQAVEPLLQSKGR